MVSHANIPENCVSVNSNYILFRLICSKTGCRNEIGKNKDIYRRYINTTIGTSANSCWIFHLADIGSKKACGKIFIGIFKR